MSYQFADISSNNPLPDLAAYKAAGHRHLCRKVSEGTAYHWVAGDTVADRAHHVGLTVGHYHWLRPEQSATAQAHYFLTLVRGHLKPGDWLMADFERTANVADPSDVVRAAQLEQFTAEVHKQLPAFPLYVYTGNWYLDGKPHCQAAVRKWPVVMSDYSGTATLPNPYRLTYAAWQFTDRATVAGFSAPVDYNRWIKAPAAHTTSSNSTTALTGDDMPRIVKDRQTSRRYLLIADRPPIYVSATGAAEYAALWGLPSTLPVVEHKTLLDYERRMKSPKSKVQAK